MTTVRPLRHDAARNRERLIRAAREVFRDDGLAAPLERIAQRADVAIGTLYNRFPTRGDLIDAALAPLARQAVQIAENATHATDPWQAFTSYMEGICELLADDRGYADLHRSRIPGTPETDDALQRMGRLKSGLVARAKDAGALRADVEAPDLVLLMWAVAAVADATREIDPNAWRRHLALALDGLRPDAAHPLPAPPLTYGQLRSTAPQQTTPRRKPTDARVNPAALDIEEPA